MSSPEETSTTDGSPRTVTPLEALDATIEMARPAQPAQPGEMAQTVEIARPRQVAEPPPGLSQPVSDATLEMQGPGAQHYQPERRASQRASGEHRVKVPLPLPAYALKLGEVLVQMGKLNRAQVEEAVSLARESGERLGGLLVRWGLVSPDVMCRALSIQTGLPMTVLEGGGVPEVLSKVFPLAMMMHHKFVPFDQSSSVVCVATCNPFEPETLKELEKSSRKLIEVFLAREDQIDRQLDMLRVKLRTRSRRTARLRKHVTCAFQFCSRQGVRSSKQICKGTTLNVGDGGFLIECEAPDMDNPAEAMRHGMYINLCLKVGETELWSVCEVREIRLSEAQMPVTGAPLMLWLMGVEILEMTPESRLQLRGLVKKK